MKHIGNISVDAGICMIGDPCYSIQGPRSFTWEKFCDSMNRNNIDKNNYCEPFTQGEGIVVRTGWGDGSYPVYVKKTRQGRIAEVRIVFIEESEDE